MAHILTTAVLPLLASFTAAQEAESPTRFSTGDAAQCAAIFAFTLDAMQTAPNVPRQIRNAMRDGLAIWEYELAASAPGATTETLQSAADRAIAYVRADLPPGDTPDAAQKRGEFLTQSARACQEKIAVSYNGAEHPVIPYLRQAEVTVEAPSNAPVPTPVADTSAPVAPKPPAARTLR